MNKKLFFMIIVGLFLIIPVTTLGEEASDAIQVRNDDNQFVLASNTVILPEGIETIKDNAFAYTGLKHISLPRSLKSIGTNAFLGCDGLVVAVYDNSYALQYCKENKIPYELIEEKNITLVYAEVNPLKTTVAGQVGMHFAERVHELTGGTVTIDMQGAGVLGSEGDYCDDMIGGIGTIDMARLSISTLTGYGNKGVPKSKLLCLPFTFTSRDHFWNFAASDIAQEFMDEPMEDGLGLHGLFFGEEGFRHIFCNKPVSSLTDLQGLKIRVSTDPNMVGMIKAFGAIPTIIAYSELYTSLQTDVVDGAENPLVNYKANSFYEVAPYVLLDGHQLGVFEIVITDTAWNKLTEQQQAAIMNAAKECQTYNKQLSDKKEKDCIAELGEKITVVEVDKSEWIAKCNATIKEATAGYTELYQKIMNLK